jgi:glutamate-ammonia-ligase adenylyltransferase
MVEDRQTHTIPATAEGIDALAAFLGFADTAAFRAELGRHRRAVEGCYGRLFEQAPTLAGPGNLVFTGTEDDPATITTLARMGFANPQAVTAQIRGWHHGRYRAMRSQRARELLTELTPLLLTTLGKSAAPDDAFLRFDAFLAALPAGVQLFALFQENPDLLQLMADVLGSAPRVAAELARNPSVLDAVLTQDFFGALPDRTQIAHELDPLLARAPMLEDALDRTRRHVAETRFRAAAQILRGITDGPRIGRYLADVADAAIEALLPRVEAEFAERHGRFDPPGFGLLAMGRLGARRMSVASDLDLVPIYPDLPDGAVSDGEKGLMAQTYFARLTQRAIAALTAPTAAGRLYEVDLRLRPSGDKGPLSVSLESFRRYHLESAWTWEHMALTRARAVYGPPELRAAIEATVRQVLLIERDPEKLRADVVDMRARIAKEKPAPDGWDVKYGTGGLVDIEFAVQYLVLRHAHAHPDILSPETETALARLAEAGLLPADAARDLVRALDLCWRVQGFLRLALDERLDPATAPPALLAGLARAVAGPDSEQLGPIDFEDAETILRSALRRASARCQAVFAS